MEQLDIHKNISMRLEKLLEIKKVPNIIFHGPSGSGKRTIVDKFVKKIYNKTDDNNENMNDYIMDVNCAHGKGIKFIREELKFFAKTNIKQQYSFKTVILNNADKLTTDAQSALRRCIELFSHTTRFFIIVENKYRLLKPILSRLCDIYIPEPVYKNKTINLHKYNLDLCFKKNDGSEQKFKEFIKPENINTYEDILILSNKLYEKGFSSLDIIKYLEMSDFPKKKKYQYLLAFCKIKGEFRDEKLLMSFMLIFIFLRSDIDLENISFM